MLNSADTKAFMLSLKPEDVTKELIDAKFSNRYSVKEKKIMPPEISFQTEFILKKGEYINTEDVKTNAGQYMVNLVLYGRTPRIQKIVGYTAKPFTKKVIEANEALMSKASNEHLITTGDWAIYYNAIQWLGNSSNTNVASSFTPNTIRVLPEVKKLRAELYKKYAKEIAEGDPVIAVKIEKELIKVAKERLKNDVGMEVFDSGCKPKFENQYKNNFITRGPLWNPAEERFFVGKNSLSDGLAIEDMALAGTSVTTGSYTKCCLTGVAGYIVKKLFATYQGVRLDTPDSDCKSKSYREFTITDKNKDKIKNRFILDGGKLVELKKDVMPKYVGKKVKMRSPLFCQGEKLCSRCAGKAFYNQGITNVGLTTSSIGSNLLNRFMKSFHDASLNLVELDLNDIVLE